MGARSGQNPFEYEQRIAIEVGNMTPDEDVAGNPSQHRDDDSQQQTQDDPETQADKRLQNARARVDRVVCEPGRGNRNAGGDADDSRDEIRHGDDGDGDAACGRFGNGTISDRRVFHLIIADLEAFLIERRAGGETIHETLEADMIAMLHRSYAAHATDNAEDGIDIHPCPPVQIPVPDSQQKNTGQGLGFTRATPPDDKDTAPLDSRCCPNAGRTQGRNAMQDGDVWQIENIWDDENEWDAEAGWEADDGWEKEIWDEEIWTDKDVCPLCGRPGFGSAEDADFVDGFFDDQGNRIDPTSIPTPGLCILCAKYDSDFWEDEVFCTLERYNATLDGGEFLCGMFTRRPL